MAVENFRVLSQTQSADTMEALPPDNPMRGRVNLLNWDGRGMPGRHVPHGRRRVRRRERAMKWRRQRGAQPGIGERELADTWQVVSLLLDYPDAVLVERVPMLRTVVDTLAPAQREPLVEVLDTLEQANLRELQSDYVDTFDVTRKCSLHLTYFTHGDTRRRGVALVEFKQAYRKAGVEFDTDVELPDHLCVVLEFGAVQDRATAWHLLNRHRVGIEVLRAGLAQRGSPWLPAVQALRSTLPELDGDDQTALLRLVAEGPPAGGGRARAVRHRPAAQPAPRPRRHHRDARHDDPRRSPPMTTFLWVIVPYVCLAVFVVGHVWRYRYDKFGWTTRSSQLYEDRLLRIGSPLFHFGMLGVVAGHIIGLVIPQVWTERPRPHPTRLPRHRARQAASRRASPPSPGSPSSSTVGAPPGRCSARRPSTTRSCTPCSAPSSCWACGTPWRGACCSSAASTTTARASASGSAASSCSSRSPS